MRFAAARIYDSGYFKSPAAQRSAVALNRNNVRAGTRAVSEDAQFEVTFEHRTGYLYAFVTGPRDDRSVSKRFWEQVYDRAVAVGVRKVLVEEDFPNQLTTMDTFDVAEFVAQLFGSAIKLAHVDQRSPDHELKKFGETVAVNRGLWGRVFDNPADAEAWLTE